MAPNYQENNAAIPSITDNFYGDYEQVYCTLGIYLIM